MQTVMCVSVQLWSSEDVGEAHIHTHTPARMHSKLNQAVQLEQTGGSI